MSFFIICNTLTFVVFWHSPYDQENDIISNYLIL